MSSTSCARTTNNLAILTVTTNIYRHDYVARVSIAMVALVLRIAGFGGGAGALHRDIYVFTGY